MKFKFCRTLAMILLFCFLSTTVAYAENTSDGSLVSYAISWADNPNIPYVWGGGRGTGVTLETLSTSSSSGTDCSGFVSLVYAHFGVTLSSQSESIYSEAKEVFYDQSKAVPGDVCWWSGHVAIYIGDNKIVHTNTSDPGDSGVANLIHITSLDDYRVGSDPVYLRMVNDISILGTVSTETEEAVKVAKSTGSLVTESDLTGMPIESTLLAEQKRLNLKGRDDLSQADQTRLVAIETALNAQKVTLGDRLFTIVSFIGLLVVLYGVFMIAFFIFDYTNTFIEISLLSVLSFGKWRIVSQEDVHNGIVKAGHDKTKRVTYLTPKMLVFRSVVVCIVGFLLISGVVSNFIASIVYRFI